MTRLDPAAVRQIAEFRTTDGCAISLYVDLDPHLAPTARDLETRSNSLLSEASKQKLSARDGLTHAQREALRADLQRIEGFFDDFDRDGVRGLAIFASKLDGFWRTLPLPDPVSDAVGVGREFRLGPLVPLLHDADGSLVVHVSREQGRLFRLEGRQLQELADLTEEQPGQHDQGGWSQPRYQRHIEKLVHDHLKEVATDLDRRSRTGGAPRIVLVCPEETKSEFVEELSKETRQAIVGWTHVEAHATPPQLLDSVTPLLEQALAEDEAEFLDRWREQAATSGRAASGWADTLEAASDARVELLLAQDGAGEDAYECPQCGRGRAEGGECPLDGTRLEPADGLDVAVRHTLLHGGRVLPIRHERALDPVEGIAALLRF
jgi:peptide chain release factor subunit 1